MAVPLFEAIRQLLRDRPVGLQSEMPHDLAPPPRPAAVLVPLFLREGELQIVLTRRAATLAHHPGQISFPGGRRDPADADPCATALREAEEEIGLRRADVDVLGPLDRLETITNFRVSPFVAAIPAAHVFAPEVREVAAILELPLREFLAPEALQVEDREFFGQMRRVYGYTVRGELVWGATGRIVHHLLELIAPLLVV